MFILIFPTTSRKASSVNSVECTYQIETRIDLFIFLFLREPLKRGWFKRNQGNHYIGSLYLSVCRRHSLFSPYLLAQKGEIWYTYYIERWYHLRTEGKTFNKNKIFVKCNHVTKNYEMQELL